MLLALCFPNWNQTWLCWLALGPVLSAIWFGPAPARRRWLRDALLGYTAGLVFFTVTFWWLDSLAPLFHSPWLAGIPPLLACYLSLYFAFWGWVMGLLPRGAIRSFLSSGRNLAHRPGRRLGLGRAGVAARLWCWAASAGTVWASRCTRISP